MNWELIITLWIKLWLISWGRSNTNPSKSVSGRLTTHTSRTSIELHTFFHCICVTKEEKKSDTLWNLSRDHVFQLIVCHIYCNRRLRHSQTVPIDHIIVFGRTGTWNLRILFADTYNFAFMILLSPSSLASICGFSSVIMANSTFSGWPHRPFRWITASIFFFWEKWGTVLSSSSHVDGFSSLGVRISRS